MKSYNLGPSPTDPKCSSCVIVWAVLRRRDGVVKLAAAVVHIDTDVEVLVLEVREPEEQELAGVAVSVRNDLARGKRFRIADWNGEGNESKIR